MKLSYTDINNQYLRNIGLPGSTDTQVSSNFNLSVMAGYELMMAELENWTTQIQATAATVANQQFYHYPVNTRAINDLTLLIGSINYPVTVINSQLKWDYINQVIVAVTNIPQFFFPRRDDFGIWPIPQSIYTLTLNYNTRTPMILNTADYTTGTVTVTNGSQTVTGSGATFTASMINQSFNASGLNDAGWYRISGQTASTLTLETAYEGTTTAGITYRVGQVPELPDEAHILLSYFAAAEYYSGMRKDVVKGGWWENKFWTGDGANSRRDNMDFKGGLLGLKRRYAARSNTRVIDSSGMAAGWASRAWGYKLS